eukprot:TRINITY_DN649_c0_g1_i2.p1 TRINITY_DN649_c0_g1~~TRINITY_DN649_c0_g1_i2.p1  ORF type:complete len:178 (+),score=57.60 TRINITY_DN649_c0_g1_i2:167-700(+)
MCIRDRVSTQSTGALAVAMAAAPENSSQRAGIPVDLDEIKAAFEFFDVNKKGKLNAADLKQRCSIFYKSMTPKDYKLLVGETGEITLKQLQRLLVQNELEDYDPVKEAFKVYDPSGSGFAEPEILRGIFKQLDYGEITDEDLQVLIQAADVDGDGKISLEDFRGMLQFNKEKEKEHR